MSQTTPDAPLAILMVEDNRADVFLFEAALKQLGVPYTLHVLTTGIDAQHQFQRYADDLAPKPDLVVLDINLPGLNGREILQKLADENTLLDLPICVVTSAGFEKDIVKDFATLNLCFESKTADFNELRAAVTRLIAFARKAPHSPSCEGSVK